MGSNPILSAHPFSDEIWENRVFRIIQAIWRSTQEAEGTPLERVQVVNSGARVQISPSPVAVIKQQNVMMSKRMLQQLAFTASCV